MEFTLKPFPFDQIGNDYRYHFKHNSFLISGNSNSEINHLLKDLLHYHKTIPLGLIFTTEERKVLYEDYMPEHLIHTKVSKKTISAITKRQRELFKNRETDDSDRRIFVVFDSFQNSHFQKSKDIRFFMQLGRTFSILTIFIFRNPIPISPLYFSCFDFVFIQKNHLIPNEDIYKSYCKNEISFDIYQQLMDHLNMSEFLVIHLYTRDDSLDNIFYYKGSQKETFKMCCEEAWNLKNDEFDEMIQYKEI